MPYMLTDDQRDLVQLVDDFLTNELDPIVMECDEKSEMPMQVLKQGLDMGLHMLDIPEEYGGMGLDYMTFQILIQTMAAHDIGITSTFALTSAVLRTILSMGNDAQKDKYVKMAVDGSCFAFALTETIGSSDAVNMRTKAVRDGDHYILNGSKIFITSGSLAGAVMVFAVTDKSKGAHGISCFMVDAGTPGFTVGKHENKLGLRLSPTTELVFQDCAVPAANLLGPEGEGYITAMKILETSRIIAASQGLGVAARALREAVNYTNTRTLKGKPILDLQGISFKLARLDAQLEACRSLIGHTVQKLGAGLPCARECCMCKLLSTDLAADAAAAAVQVFGGYGVCKEYPVEKLYRDAKVLQIVEGANEVQTMLIGRTLRQAYLPG